MNSVYFTFSIFLFSFLFNDSKSQGTFAGTNPFMSGQVGVYPPGSIVVHPQGARITYPAGILMNFQFTSTLQFPFPTWVYSSVATYVSGDVVFPAGSIISLAPGTTTTHPTTFPLVYRSFNGNTRAIVAYVNDNTVTYSNCSVQPSYFPLGTNSINYYNPGVANTGGPTQFGISAPQVNSILQRLNSDGTVGDITCTGYTENGWPRRSIRNIHTGEVQESVQTSTNTYLVTTRGVTITLQSSISYTA